MAQMQTNRHVELITPLGEDVLLFSRMSGTEELGRLFQFDLELLSKKPDIKFEDLLGQNVTIRLDLPDRKNRYFNGFVTRFNQSDVNTEEDYTPYSATISPWFWFLTRTADCRIFQNKTVPDIIKEIFRDHGFTDFEDKLTGTYRNWEYCVQYRETDFNFVSRLMEQEGIYYFFKHEENKHMLVLADDISAHTVFPDYEEIPYYPPDSGLRREKEHIHDWNISQEVKPGVYALNEFNFKKPRANMEVKAAVSRDHVRSNLEIFDYPGEYEEANDGESYVRARIEEIHAQYEQISGQTNARGFCVGHLFKLSGYPRKDQNREYLVESAAYEIESNAYDTSGPSGETYFSSFTVLESKTPFRPARITPKPVVQGPQTAIVVGNPGEEITTEEYGQVKIQFHWDRYGKKDINSSCWVRVSHPWAGKNWGSVAIPRYGQEVIVEFLEGDPDHPIITGRVYNKDTMPPYDLPGSGMVSGLKSNSTPGGGGYNEMSMDDTKGNEKITVHAQYDMNTTVENDQTLVVHNNRTDTIDVDDSETVKGNQTLSVKGNRTETVNGTENVTIDGATTHTIKADYTRNVAGNYTLSADSNIKSTAKGNWDGIAKGTLTLDAPEIKLNAGSKIEIACGGSSIVLEKAKITISSGSGNIDVHAPGVDVKGGKIQLN
ncbi:type VI secretion system tip protein TssI/VgrG [uncultured Desulfobacter sp.]|uniref:type VI secretion system tip protein TssI/VgrG n=1 Tax=uncultured Desulfobacter sp. TaxID=240139 RepID=UPI002AA69F8F|nr:type VI secretion system tip protein TssI/VgrG [uncultured Desulfobacter sp.]